MNYETTEEYEFDSHRPTTTSGGTSVKAGWVIAQVALTMTGLVLCFLLGYVLFSQRQRRLALERYEQQQQEQQRHDMVKSQERAKTIQETLQWVVYRSFARTNSSSRSGGGGSSICSSSDDSEASIIRSTADTGCMIQRDVDFDGETDEDDHVTDIEAQEHIVDGKDNNNSSSSSNSESNDEHEEHCCSICFGAYEPDHQIGISSNQECLHAFHRECITEWLFQHDECPVCRRSYLGAAPEEDEDIEDGFVGGISEGEAQDSIQLDINC